MLLLIAETALQLGSPSPSSTPRSPATIPLPSLRPIKELCRITRLGQGLVRTGQLAPEAVQRTLAVLQDYATLLDQLQVSHRAAIGTAALREAHQREDFLAQAQAILKCPVEIISGQREAALVLAGVQGAFGVLGEPALLFDVGGGSTELILHHPKAARDKPTPLAMTSLDIGAVRLTERHLHHDPPLPAEIRAVQQDSATALQQLPAAWSPAAAIAEQPPRFIGIAGTVTTLATVQLGLAEYDTDQVNGLVLTRAQVQEQIARFARSSLAERKHICGLEPARADIILAGALIVDAILDHFAGTTLRVCDRGIRWGRIWELFAELSTSA